MKTPYKHVGELIRAEVLPDGLTVTKAAELLDVSRPALSNLLNGKSVLSEQMAARLAKAFGADAEQLLAFRPADEGKALTRARAVLPVRRHVPSLTHISAGEIHDWSDTHAARDRLPVLLRKLALSSGAVITKIDFPGYDNSQRKGADGVIEASSPSPWVPEGRSHWEFGCDKTPASKADSDYNARLSLPRKERLNTTFVFVTPRNWPGKTEWERRKKAAGDWKDVIAFDASDLEQAVEQSTAVQTWLSEQLGKSADGATSLDERWRLWAGACEQPLTPDLFADAVAQHAKLFARWLDNPPSTPYLVSADSREEALAYLYCLFNSEMPELAYNRDRVVVINSSTTLRKLASPTAGFIPVIADSEAERQLGDLPGKVHTIILRPKNVPGDETDIALDILRCSQLEDALQSMGIDREEAQALWRKTGGSPTVLRRQLANLPEVRVPEWAENEQVARRLCPLWLAGNWNAGFEADKEVLKIIAGIDDYADIETRVSALMQLESPPVWKVGNVRGTVSKIDALYATARYLQAHDLENFFRAAELVLSERDPAVDLPEDQRWAAGVYGKVRKHSGVLRESICETLCILSVHGDELFGTSLGFSVRARVDRLVGGLFYPLTPEKLESQKGDLPHYAEAAPEVFLDLIEEDLKNGDQVFLSLMRPADSGAFGGCPRTGLLWALENLAWDPPRLTAVIGILARLARVPLDDNWANKPISSLLAIFRCWMPQTAAPLERRKRALDYLVEKFPEIGWEICLDQFRPGSRIGHKSHRPNWRADASGAGAPVTRGEANDFALYAFGICVDWAAHDAKTLGALVRNLSGVGPELHDQVWDKVETWARETDDDHQKAELRETIRQSHFTRRGRRRKNAAISTGRAPAAMDLLHPADLTERHRWLFDKHWVEFSASELEEGEPNWEDRDRRIEEARKKAAAEVFEAEGAAGIWRLVAGGEGAYVAGWSLGAVLDDPETCATIIAACLGRRAEDSNIASGLISGIMGQAYGANRLKAVVDALPADLSDDDRHALLQCLPFLSFTWDYAASLGLEFETAYWRDVHPTWARLSGDELRRAAEALLAARRPRAAFFMSHFKFEDLETGQMETILRDCATVPPDHDRGYQLTGHDIAQALQTLSDRTDVSHESLAQLEFFYLQALDHTDYRLSNLNRQIAEHPQMFVEAIIYAYKRSDDAQDPERYRAPDDESMKNLASNAHAMLRRIADLPGHDREGDERTTYLLNWMEQVRKGAADVARARICDYQLGELFARSPNGDDGLWPCEAAREAIEEIGNKSVSEGMQIGIYNSRGVHWRGPGGDQERELADKYRGWGEALADRWPATARILFSVAESYEKDAKREDQEAVARGRLRGWS